MASDFKTQSNGWVVDRDGTYRDPGNRRSPSFQLRKGTVVPEEAAKRLKRIGPWPGEKDPEDDEAAAVAAAKKVADEAAKRAEEEAALAAAAAAEEAKRANDPENKKAKAPENK